MSQFFQGVTAGSLPPTVPTSFQTQDGTAIPLANVLIVNAYDTTQNNDNGIETKGNTNGGDPPGTGAANEVDVYLTNRISVTATTSDGGGQTKTVTLMTPTNATAVEFGASIIGYDSANNEAAGGSQEGIARKSAGLVVVVGTNDSLDESDSALDSADWDVIASGADLSIRFVGVAGRTIVWRCTFTYIQTP
jgi:hypothetical protein